ncbi:MAG TPA: hydrogenase nickel incorporation protein HypB [Spirochaetota bacterium]|nr:hydrogenase nickel incorporation protein HypB [Spirochaetota bacterium]HNT10179.1 hydrogenase nickel incorporation protein HypB [Spirochaetota bacterium]HNV48256.1 hydrogenase nickel incorporation protein HypB [Spirochaetota bacterium]HOS42026.1 hydrogenase nickel incorporation protein HypB [Spirochaetota bacterium]HPI23652.1 hydrogenase nickel incorporation protein HypB [Spirochaetota bacterium]
MEIKVLQDIFESNRNMADEIAALLKEKKVYMIDLMSSPGSGKTTITDRLIGALKGSFRIAVIEGDIKTTKDAEKLAKHDIPIIQIETARFSGDCHLESSWIRKCLDGFDLDNLDLVIIENIGNLVCPAEFQLGDDERIVVLSVTEGEDKPVKYPLMFNSSHTLLLNKIDLLPHLEYSMDEVMENVRRTNPTIVTFPVSAKTGEGFDAVVAHLARRIREKTGK